MDNREFGDVVFELLVRAGELTMGDLVEIRDRIVERTKTAEPVRVGVSMLGLILAPGSTLIEQGLIEKFRPPPLVSDAGVVHQIKELS